MAGLNLLSDQGFRIDGRKPNELRRIQCKLGVFKQADGSAYIEQGNTKVLATVYGPHEIRGSRAKLLLDRVLVNCQYSMATFSTGERKRRPRGDRKSQEMTMHLKQTFDAAIMTNLYPRSQIDIFVEVLQSDGGNYCASVNAATLALIDAGIPMKDFVCACSASFVNDNPIADINYLEESSGGPELIVATLPKSDQIVFLEQNSRLHEDNLSKVIDLAVKSCKDVYTVLDRTVRDHVSEVSNSHGWDH
ncbi:exosome complex component RRP41-like [Mytilus californianus]|uniref:Exosome complex component RRP41 n=1 Tax=Mytilus coruscus TaxID=42192 RepID=A0A6J8DMF5_MYTCO|nr:exosome complex component RRP41-like [Mytilus californianus]CAC5408927.1 RRP41 [Mytilus coruscus]